MSGQNRYEPSVEPVTTANNEVRPEEETQDNGLSYDRVMDRASDQSTPRQDVTNFSERTDLTGIQDQTVREALTQVDNAKAAALLLSLNEVNQPDSTPIPMQDANGRPYTVTLGQVKQSVMEELTKHSQFRDFGSSAKLREFIGQSSDAALTLGQRQPEIYETKTREAQTVVNARNDLAAKLGFPATTYEVPDGNGGKMRVASYDISARDIENRLARTTDTAQRAQLDSLKELVTRLDGLQKERGALSKVDVVAAQLMMGGYTHKEGEQTLPNSPATRQETMRAYELMNRVGRGNQQIETAPQFQEVRQQASSQFSNINLQRSSDAVNALQAADQLRVAGKITEAQAKYEEALKKVKEVDMATITTQWAAQMQEFNRVAEKLNALGPNPNPQEAQRLQAELQQRQDIGLQLEQIIQVGKEVKVQYATFLNEQGKSNEALPLLSSVAAQTPPELLAGDKTYEAQMEKASRMGSITSGDAEKHRVLYEQAMAAKDWSTAERELGSLKEASIKASEASIQGAKDKIAAMTKRQTEIDTELAQLAQNSEMSQEAKTLRQTQLNNEKNGYDTLRKALEDGLGPAEKAAEEHKHQLRYMEGIIAYSKDDKDTAHKIFKELEAEAPEIAANKDYQLEGLLEDTRKKGWWERNWDTIVNVGKFVAIGAAIIAAGAVTGGVGAVALGAALGAAGVFTVGAAGHQIAKANEWKSTDNYHNWRPGQDLAMGAIGGGGGALLGRVFQGGGMALAGEKLATTGGSMVAQGGFRAAAGYGAQGLGHTMRFAEGAGKFAFSKVGTPVTGTAYGFGTEGIDVLKGGQFNVNEALAKSVTATGALYGARGVGGMGTFGGQAMYTGISTSGDLVQDMTLRNQSFDAAWSNVLGNAGQHFFEATAVGSIANINNAARAHALTGSNAFTFQPVLAEGTRAQIAKSYATSFGHNAAVNGRMLWSTLGGAPAHITSQAKILDTVAAIPRGAGGLTDEAAAAITAARTPAEAANAIKLVNEAGLPGKYSKPLLESLSVLEKGAPKIRAWEKAVVPTALVGGVGFLGYAEQSAYDYSRQEKDYNDPSAMVRLGINEKLSQFLRQVKKPVPVRPSQTQGG